MVCNATAKRISDIIITWQKKDTITSVCIHVVNGHQQTVYYIHGNRRQCITYMEIEDSVLHTR